MAEGLAADYHDYVFRDGQLVGDFEGMYQACPDPWRQDSIRHPAEAMLLNEAATASSDRLLDLGCGRGALTRRLASATNGWVGGVDVAPTALRVARSRVTTGDFAAMRAGSLGFADDAFDVTVIAELLWYVLESISAVLHEVRRVTRTGGRVLVLQQFYQPGEQQYGAEIMNGPEDLINLLPFPVLRTIEFDRFSNHKVLAVCVNEK